MSTKPKKAKRPSPSASENATSDSIMPKRGQPLSELVKELQKVNTRTKEAKANETSMDDNNGGRVWYPWLWEGLKGLRKSKKGNRK